MTAAPDSDPGRPRHSERAPAFSLWRRRLTTGPGIAAGFLLVTLLLVGEWPHLRSAPPHQDVGFSIWRIAWIAHQLPRSPLHLFDANNFGAERNTLALSDAVLMEGIVASPLIWIGVPPIVVYNLLVLLSFPATGFAMFLLVRRLTGSAAAAWVAGLVLAFTVYRFHHYIHLELLWGFWSPLALWAFHRTLDTGRVRDGVLTGLFVAAQELSSIYYGIFLAAALVILTAGFWAAGRLPWRSRSWRALGLGAVTAAILVLPYARPYLRTARDVGVRDRDEVMLYSAAPVNYLASPSENQLYGWTATRWGGNEKNLFPGLVAIVLLVVALWPPIDRLRAVYVVALIVLFDLSLGGNGVSFFWLREHVPFFQGLRVPARAGMLTVTLLATLAGLGFARLVRARPIARRPALAAALVAVVSGVVVLEAWRASLPLRPYPVQAPLYARWLAGQPPSTVLELPAPTLDRLPGNDSYFQFLSIFHWQRLANGYSGAYPQSYAGLIDRLDHFPDARAIRAIRNAHIDFVILHSSFFGRGEFEALDATLRTHPDFEFLMSSLDDRGVVTIYRVR